MLNCIIIDDEQFSVEVVTKYIKLLPKLNIVGIYNKPELALDEIKEDDSIDLLFMDVDMPNMSGIELAKALRSKTRKLIFTTAHSKYALDAYEAEGDAFLLKPFTFAKFSTTVKRLFPNESAPKPAPKPALNLNDDYFLVKNKEEDLRIIKVDYKDVIAFESSHNYVKIHLADTKTILAYLTIKDVLALIANRPEFKQLHRAFIISTDCISYIEGNVIKMQNNLTFTVGESYRPEFVNYISNKLFRRSGS